METNEQQAKIYKKAPLPFLGQKKYFLKLFNICLNEFLYYYKGDLKDLVFLDCFGGSGLLSHTIKQKIPQARVIWNDFDNYQRRLDEIPHTNELIAKFERIKGYKEAEKLSEKDKSYIIECLREQEQKRGFVDYITIFSFYGFSSGKFTTLKEFENSSLYYRKINYKNAVGYLEGVERVSVNFKALINEFKDNKNVFLILDPPYLQTNQQGYKEGYYRLGDFLELVRLIKPPYIFFSSEKSDFLDFMKWDLEANNNLNFKDCKIKEANHSKTTKEQKSTKDYLVYKFN